MRSFPTVGRRVSDRSPGRAFELYQAACDEGGQPLERCWRGLESSATPSTLAALVKQDLQRRFDLGERPRVAEYLERYPILAESDDRVVSLVYEEFCLLQESGEEPDSADFCDAYSRWRDSLASQLVYHRELSRAIGSEPAPVAFPAPGERFERYLLDSVLGTGGVARVYLATEDDLGGRKVALKVSASFGQEPSILGKLDHGNIVPILTVARSESGLTGICMPYREGLTLEALIRKVGRGNPPSSARAIGDQLKPRHKPAGSTDDDARSGWVDFPAKGTYSEAVAWIGLALANALAYLHGRGVFHRDIKPANVLLAYKGGPQLLDFNLAQDPNAPEEVKAALKGGTLPYMAPEQLKAFIDPSAWERVDASADLYSLGLVLKELMTGQAPELPPTRNSLPRSIQALIDRREAPQVPVRSINPGIPSTLGSIIEKCLAFRPVDRYEKAADLATDLRLFLARKPLKFAPNLSKVERSINFLHRNRFGIAVATLALLIFGLLPPSSISRRSDFRHAEGLLNSRRPGDFERARVEFEEIHRKLSPSGWTSLYLAIALEEIINQKGREGGPIDKSLADRQGELLNGLLLLPDAEEAVAARLESEPDSPLLLMMMGRLKKERKENEEARQFLERSLSLDPERVVSLISLADVYRGLRRYEESAGLFEKAIRIGESGNPDRDWIYQARRALLPIYIKLADPFIDSQTKPTNWGLVSKYLDLEARTLRGFRKDWEILGRDGQGLDAIRGGNPSDIAIYEVTGAIFEGCLASGRGVVAAEGADQAGASKLFQEARASFEKATRSIRPGMPGQDNFEKLIRNQEKKLEERSARSGLPRQVAATGR